MTLARDLPSGQNLVHGDKAQKPLGSWGLKQPSAHRCCCPACAFSPRLATGDGQ